MAGPLRDLSTIQRWLQSVITNPDGVAMGIDSPAARAAIDVSATEAEQVVTRSTKQDGLARLEVYANAYHERLLECMRQEFAVLCRTLGEETFDGLAFGYLQSYPSRSYTLSELGHNFPQFLAEQRDALSSGDDADGEPDWSLLMIELAQFERLVYEVFDGPGVEGVTLLQAEDLAAIPGERWSQAHLVPAECLRLAHYQFPVHEFFNAAKADAEASLPAPRDSWVALSRMNYVVRQFDISRPQFELLSAIVEGLSVGQAIERAAGFAGSDIDALAQSLHAWFQQWTADGLFRAVETGD